MVTDVPLTELFNGETEEPTNNNNTSPEAERRLKDSKYEENDGSVMAEKKITSLAAKMCVKLHFLFLICVFRSSGVQEV